MHSIVRFLLILGLSLSCNSKGFKSHGKEDVLEFSVSEIVSASHALTAVIDWPSDTIDLQNRLEISPKSAKNMILPLHPLWDKKIEEVSRQIFNWDHKELSSILSSCSQRCECEFYQEALLKNPKELENASVEIRNFTLVQIQRTKAWTFNCLEKLVDLKKILNHLKKESPKFEAKSVY